MCEHCAVEGARIFEALPDADQRKIRLALEKEFELAESDKVREEAIDECEEKYRQISHHVADAREILKTQLHNVEIVFGSTLPLYNEVNRALGSLAEVPDELP